VSWNAAQTSLQQVGDVGALALIGGVDRAVLQRQLRGGRDLDRLERLHRALGEGRERAQRLDLDVEQLDAHGALAGRRVEVEQSAADGELAAVLDLLDALVAALDELAGALVEVEQVADAQLEGVWAQLGVGHLLRQRRSRDDDDRRVVCGEQRVERRDPQADEVRRRREVRLVGDAARGVVAHDARGQPRCEIAGQVARGAVVGSDDDRRDAVRRALGHGVEQRREEERAQRSGAERLAAVAGERDCRLVLGDVCQQVAQHQPSTIAATSSAARSTSSRTSAAGSRKRPST
jgi:hypothetical protein